MMDYRGIEALFTVVERQSFEEAAKALHITQSAVSQRIKGLEAHYGEPLLIRILPYRTTPLGKTLIGHYKRVTLLEEALTESTSKISIALNRDSLETWFLDLIEKRDLFEKITLEVITDDQELTLDYFKQGSVSACLSTSERKVSGGKVTYLGEMEYQLVATAEFAKKHLKTKKDLLTAPAVKFDRNDYLHERYLEKFFGLNGSEMTFHVIPSVAGFKKYVLLGYGYALMPSIELQKEKLVSLYPNKVWKMPIYWHSWDLPSESYHKFNTEIIALIRKRLSPPKGDS